MRIGTRIWIGAALAAMAFPATASAQGIYLPGGGAMQGGMAGVSTAAPIDAIGALYWNPAAIGKLGHSEASIGGAFLFPDISVASSLPRQGFGRTQSDSGVGLASTLGVVYQPDDSKFTYGLGLFTLGGGGVNFPGDPSNPVLAPVGPAGKTVIGPIFSSMTMLQLAPTVSYKVTDKLVVGLGPTIDVTLGSFSPAFFARPDDANGDGIKTFPSATNSRPFWGGGFRAGLVYSLTDTIDLGFGYTSPQWLETWKFYSHDELGNPETLALKLSLPAIYSWGIAYKGIDKLLLALDLRYFDYKNTDLFGPPVVNGGLGWNSTFVAAVGANYQLTSRMAVRAGYQYNTNPLASTSTLFNVQSPAITQNTITFGTTFVVTDSLAMSLGYSYGFQNSVTGTAKEFPGATIKLDTSMQSILFNIQIKFGSCGKRPSCTPTCDVVPAAASTTGSTAPAGNPALPQ